MNIQRILLRIVAASEAAAGLAVLLYPPIGARLLLGSQIAGAGIFMSRIAGIALISLGVACWPEGAKRALLGMTVYSALVTVYMAGFSLNGSPAGILWWPAFAIHVVLTIVFTWWLVKS